MTFETGVIIATPFIVSGVAFLLNRSLFKKIDEIAKEQACFRSEFSNHKVEIVKTFATKEDLRPNEEAHRELWKEVNGVRERVAKLEG